MYRDGKIYRVRDFVYDPSSRVLSDSQDRKVKLRPQEAKFFQLLLDHPDKGFSSEELQGTIWPNGKSNLDNQDVNRVVSDLRVKKLRQLDAEDLFIWIGGKYRSNFGAISEPLRAQAVRPPPLLSPDELVEIETIGKGFQTHRSRPVFDIEQVHHRRCPSQVRKNLEAGLRITYLVGNMPGNAIATLLSSLIEESNDGELLSVEAATANAELVLNHVRFVSRNGSPWAARFIYESQDPDSTLVYVRCEDNDKPYARIEADKGQLAELIESLPREWRLWNLTPAAEADAKLQIRQFFRLDKIARWICGDEQPLPRKDNQTATASANETPGAKDSLQAKK